MCVREHTCVVAACTCMAEDNLQKLVLSFRSLGPKNQTQPIRPGDEYLYPVSHLTGFSINVRPQVLPQPP